MILHFGFGEKKSWGSNFQHPFFVLHKAIESSSPWGERELYKFDTLLFFSS
jgi:hypothetical protein